MKLNNDKRLCPFCLTSWYCEGPHIEQKDEQNFLDYLLNIKEDYIESALQVLRQYSSEKNLDLNELTNLIIDKLKKRN
jgi:hypothetical protein